MVYKGGYVVCILKDGRPLENTGSSSIVLLPYGKAYGVRLRNKNPNRCQASVHIDGEYIGTWVLDGNDYADIYRPVKSDTAFIFAHKDSKESVKQGKDKTLKDDTGLVEVVFSPEKVYEAPIIKYDPPKKYYDPPKKWGDDNIKPQWLNEETSYKGTTACDFDGPSLSSCRSLRAAPASSPSLGFAPNDVGVTVKGGATGQIFRAIHFIPDLSQQTKLIIQLKGYVEEERPQSYCPECGAKKTRKSAKYCDQCGQRVS